MTELLIFLNRLNEANIHYTIGHHRDDYIMVKVDIRGERWEVEFGKEGEIETEIFKNSDGVHTGKELLEKLFSFDNDIGFNLRLTLHERTDVSKFTDSLVANIVEPMGFAIGGNPFSKDGAFITKYDAGDVTTKEKAEFELMLQKEEAVKGYDISGLRRD